MTVSRRAAMIGAASLPAMSLAARAASAPGTLTFGLSSYPPNLQPWSNAGTAQATVKLMMFRGLLSYAPDGSLRDELAESWGRDGETAWVFRLRDAVFHNGKPVTSADVKWTVEQVAAERSTAYLRAEFQRVERIETPDPRTVRFVMRAPTVTLPLLLANYHMPIIAAGSPADAPVGAGPFVLTAQERGVSVEFAAFNRFYRPGLPLLKSVRFAAYADENLRVAALQAGDVDVIEYVPWQSMQSIESDPALRLDSTFGPFMNLVFNGRTGPFADARLRAAVGFAIKRDEIVKAAFFGRGKPMPGLPIPEDSQFYDAARANHWAYDPDRARALLKAAGKPDGFPCALLSTAQYGMHKDTAEIVQQNLAAVGIQVELKLPDWATRVSLGNRGQYEFAVMGTAAESNDPDGLTPCLDTTLAPSYVRSFGLEAPAIHDLLNRGRAEFDPERRRAIYAEMEMAALEQAPFVGLAWRSQAYAMRQAVKGFANLPGPLSFYSGTTLEQTSNG